jgi:hypothetical protein
MGHIRTWADLQARVLTTAELQLIDACQKGELCQLGDGTLPPEGTPDPSRHIHANVLRYLILGGCDACEVDDIGVWVEGAHVTGTLDLDFTTTRGAIQMPNSRFEDQIECEQTNCRQLVLEGSALNGLRGQKLEVTGSVSLKEITTRNSINLGAAIIGGQLRCDNALFDVAQGSGLNIQYAQIAGAAFLTDITSNAVLNLSSARIKGQLAFVGSTISAAGKDAVFAQSAKFYGGLIWKNVTINSGAVSFDSAHIHILSDDPECWPKGETLNFDGMTYNRIAGAPTDAKTRLDWLLRGTRWQGEFYPQPYTQLAKVLYDMGHDKDARLVLEKREELIRQDERKRFRSPPEPTNRNYIAAMGYDIAAFFHWVISEKAFKFLIGYGHRPFKSIWWLLILLCLTILPAHRAWEEGSFAPNSALLQESEGWKSHQTNENPAQSWSAKDAPGHDWETFNAYAYGLDVVIPLVNFGQTQAWAPSTNRGWWGKQLYWLRWVLGALGWIVTALGAAAITGVIRRD